MLALILAANHLLYSRRSRNVPEEPEPTSPDIQTQFNTYKTLLLTRRFCGQRRYDNRAFSPIGFIAQGDREAGRRSAVLQLFASVYSPRLRRGSCTRTYEVIRTCFRTRISGKSSPASQIKDIRSIGHASSRQHHFTRLYHARFQACPASGSSGRMVPPLR